VIQELRVGMWIGIPVREYNEDPISWFRAYHHGRAASTSATVDLSVG